MKSLQNLALLWFVLMIWSYAGMALADTAGDVGEIVSVKVNAEGSDDFSAFEGELVLRRQSDGEEQLYRWGGAACPGKSLTESQVHLLFDLAATPYMLLTPFHKPGAGQNVCMVGFVATNRKFL